MAVYKIPVAAQWNVGNPGVATPDGGFVYIGCKSINYIGPIIDKNKQPLIKTINTRQNMLCIDIDPGWGAQTLDISKKYIAGVAHDNSVQIWDLDLEHVVSGHKVHQIPQGILDCSNARNPQYTKNRYVTLLSYMKNRNVLSLDNDLIVNYCVASNTYQKLANFIRNRNQVFTQLRCSPYDDEMFAVGNSRGSVYLCNLQKLQIIYTLHGHDTAVTSLKFVCTETYSLEQMNQQIHSQHQRQHHQQDQAEQRKQKQQQADQRKNPKLKELKNGIVNSANAGTTTADHDDIFDIYDYDYLENEFGAPPKQSDEVSDFVGFEKPQPTAEFDFAEACQNLKSELTAMSIDDQIPEVTAGTGGEVTLEDCKNTNVRCDDTSSCEENDDDEFDKEKENFVDGDGDGDSSLEMIDNNGHSSDEDIRVDAKQQIYLQADVHAVGEDTASVQVNETGISSNGEWGADNVDGNKARKNSCSNIHVSDVLLATISVDAHIWIWNVRTGASCDNVQLRGTQQRGVSNADLAWLNCNKLLATNKNGEFSCFMLETPQVHNIKQRYKLKPFQQLLSTRGPIIAFDVCASKELIWSVNRNRDITLENLQTDSMVAKYSGISNNIKSMCANPHDMNKIALGFRDRRLGVIDISKMEPNKILVENHVLRIESLIHCLVWSPDGSKLAFGTEEGRAGIVSVPRSTIMPQYLDPICGQPIYSMDWHGTEIFVVCNDMIGVYSDDGRKKHATIIENIKNISCVSVRSPGYLFVGTRTGKLEIYKRQNPASVASYGLVQTLDLAPRYITEISWSAIAKNLLAVVANANHLHILDFNAETGSATQLHKLACLDNPKASHACVSWSHVCATKLLTCGFDGALRVWNLELDDDKKCEFLKYYPCTLVSGMFMPTDEHVVLCTGKVTSLEMIDLRVEKPHHGVKRFRDPFCSTQWALEAMTSTKMSASETKRMKRQKAAAAATLPPTDIANIKNEQAELRSSAAQEDVVIVNDQLKQLHIVGEPKLADSLNVSLKCADAAYHKNPVSILCLVTKEMNKYPLQKLTQLLKAEAAVEDKHKNEILGKRLFGNKHQAKQLLAEELENHRVSASKGVQNLFLPLLTQNLKDEILKAITQKRLNEWLVSLAPSISYNFWQKCAQAFAEQLFEQGYALQAATYMISLHKHVESIQMLLDNHYFQEAMLVARIYVDKDDPLLVKILDKWIEFLESKGSLFTAAYVCALANDMERSLALISKVANRTNEINEIIQLITACSVKQ